MHDLTAVEDNSIFSLKLQPYRSYEYDYITQFDLTLEVGLDLMMIERKNYTLLDVLSDVGGVYNFFFASFSVLIGICNYNSFDNYMASRLFKIKKQNLNKSNDDDENYEYITPTRFCNCCELLVSTIPKKLRCCRKRK